MIDYNKIGKAQSYYTEVGYPNVEVDWVVTQHAILATLPPHKKILKIAHPFLPYGAVVASGEQSFIQMMLDGTMVPGRHQTATPCYRDEEEYTKLTCPWFFKVELISYMPDDVEHERERMLTSVLSCFSILAPGAKFDLVDTEEGTDINCNGSPGSEVLVLHIVVNPVGHDDSVAYMNSGGECGSEEPYTTYDTILKVTW